MSSFPVTRLRRLRRTGALRDLVRETSLSRRRPRPCRSSSRPRRSPNERLPALQRFTVDGLVRECEELVALGVKSVLLFGIPESKDDEGSGAWIDDGIVQQALRALRPRFPELCCSPTSASASTRATATAVSSHDGEVDNDASLELLARTAVSHVEAGADAVCPSDMMDGRIAAVRAELPQTPIVAYSAKYASAFYGPFRDAAGSAPAFGDRRGYQLDPGNVREALRECELDVAEGADVLLVKPALPYLDVVRAVRDRFDLPLAAYNVSGEYAMVKAAAAAGDLDERAAAVESLTAIRRAGADIVITYWAKEFARWHRREPRSHRALAPRAEGHPRRRQLARARDAGRRPRRAVLRDARRGRLPRDRRRPPPARLGAVVGAAALRARRPRDGRGRARGGGRRARRSARRPSARSSWPRRSSTPSRRSSSCGSSRRAPRRRCRRSGSRAAFTRRDRVLKFAGCYHGHADPFLASAGSGLATLGIPSSPGVPSGVTADTIVVPYNDIEAVAAAVALHGEGLAAILVEPVAGNMGCVPPAPGFLEALRALCDASGALLVFDEVISGFRVARGGAQELYGVNADLTILGKIVGGGLPLAAFGGRGDVLERLAPAGDVYQAGTLSGNPLATAAGLVGAAAAARSRGLRRARAARRAARGRARPVRPRAARRRDAHALRGPRRARHRVRGARHRDVRAGSSAACSSAAIYVAPSQYECLFPSLRHGDEEIDRTIDAVADVLAG